jgi:hypothetical protein
MKKSTGRYLTVDGRRQKTEGRRYNWKLEVRGSRLEGGSRIKSYKIKTSKKDYFCPQDGKVYHFTA